MLDEERRELDMYKRALACLTAEFADLPPELEGGRAAESLRADVALIDEQSSSQSAYDGTAKEGTAQRRVARNAVKEFMKRFAQTGRTIARRKPGFDERYPTPHGKNDEQLLAAAQSVAASAIMDKTDFTGLGISLDYISAAQTRVESFAEARKIISKCSIRISKTFISTNPRSSPRGAWLRTSSARRAGIKAAKHCRQRKSMDEG
jgi:hypothetical protein